MAIYRHRRTTGALTALVLLATGSGIVGQDANRADLLVSKAAAYVQAYEQRLSSVVCEERQTQLVVRANGTTSRRRELISDILIVKVGDSILSFRDVIAVEGKPVRDRQTRLRQLFLESTRAPLDQARRIASESARYNIGVPRLIDPLMLALGVLRQGSDSQFRFTSTDDGVSFEEWPAAGRERSRRRGGTDNMSLRGRFSIDPDGRVLRSTFLADHPEAELTVDVRYQEDPVLNLLLPVEMHERYRDVAQPNADHTDISSAYSACRQFRVTVDERFEVPK
jgi:hypothetical protein